MQVLHFKEIYVKVDDLGQVISVPREGTAGVEAAIIVRLVNFSSWKFGEVGIGERKGHPVNNLGQ